MRRLLPLLAILLAGPAAAGDLADEGRQIYEKGTSPTGGAITAMVGAGISLPGSALPCANCHGPDGRGRAEGGVVPPALTPQELRKPYGHVHERGRRHGPFDDASLARAITSGVDPAGNRLATAMPRYVMSRADLDRLLAHLARLDRVAAPGVSAGVLRIGTVLPQSGPAAALGATIRREIEGRFAAINDAGGIHGRRIDLVVTHTPGGWPDEPFAVIAPLVPGDEERLARWSDEARVPVIGPVGLLPAGGTWVFQVEAGLVEQARTLAEAAGGGPAAVIHGTANARAAAAATEVLRDAQRGACTDPPAQLVPKLAKRGTKAVLLLCGSEQVEAFGREAASRGFVPRLLLAGPLSARAALSLPPAFDGRVLVAFSSTPSDAARVSVGPGESRQAAVSARAAAATLLEALRRAGRDLQRERLVAALEGLHEFDAGVLAPITFGPGGRVGVHGAHLVEPDRAARRFVPVRGPARP